MKASSEYIKRVITGYVGTRDRNISRFTFKELQKFGPKNRLIFLEEYYRWTKEVYSYSRRKYFPKPDITNHFFDPKKIYLSVAEVEELLFSITFARGKNGQEAVKFINKYKGLLAELRKIAKRHIRIKNKIVKAGAWK